jgi:RNA polymerase sigma-70 factor (ECF subfamily)
MRTVGHGDAGCGCIISRLRIRNKIATAARFRLSYPAEKKRSLIQPATSTCSPARLNAEAADVASVDRVLAGDVEAFEEIVMRWQGPLVNMAWRYCRDRSRAEEMAQEAFVRAWRGLAQWRRESSFSTWLFALAANVYRSELKRFPTVAVPIEDVAEPASGAVRQDDALVEQRQHEAVRRAVLTLPLRYREPMVLYYFHEMDVGAAAGTLGMPEGTLKARLARGRELLRRRFPHLRGTDPATPRAGVRAGREAIE